MSKARSKRFRRGITIQTHHFERAINSLTVMYTWLWIKICINSISCLLCWINLTKLTKTKTNSHFCIFLFYFSYFCKCTISFQLVWVLFLLTMCLYNLVCGHTHTHLHITSLSSDPIPNGLPPVSKWGPSYRLATQEQWAPRRGNGSSKGQAILWRWREGWRDGSQGGERRGWGVMGMVWGHIFNHVTKREAAWETRLCFSNPAGRFCSTLLRSSSLSQLEKNKQKRAMVVAGPQHLNLT